MKFQISNSLFVTPALQDRLNALERIYDLYDQVVTSYDWACRPGCHHCCTANVTLTGLEAVGIIAGLAERAGQVLAPLTAPADSRRFRPAVTINTIAALTLAGEDPPQEGADPEAGPCPLLADGRCPIYPLRPFACRCMVSTRTCAKDGYASIDDFFITVNTVFQQIIEHLDAAGGTGNLFDWLSLLARPEILAACGRNQLDRQKLDLAPNRPMPAWMVPPEHRARIDPILEALRGIRLGRPPSSTP